mgnify:CR=1 FL=1
MTVFAIGEFDFDNGWAGGFGCGVVYCKIVGGLGFADVAGIDSGEEFLGGGEDGGNGFLVVLEGFERLFAEFAVVGGDADAVVGVGAHFGLVD